MISGWTAFAEPNDLAASAASPYELERYVETHRDFDWEPLRKAVGIKKDESISLPRCEGAFRGIYVCSS
jgi:hypothetical protein